MWLSEHALSNMRAMGLGLQCCIPLSRQQAPVPCESIFERALQHSRVDIRRLSHTGCLRRSFIFPVIRYCSSFFKSFGHIISILTQAFSSTSNHQHATGTAERRSLEQLHRYPRELLPFGAGIQWFCRLLESQHSPDKLFLVMVRRISISNSLLHHGR